MEKPPVVGKGEKPVTYEVNDDGEENGFSLRCQNKKSLVSLSPRMG